MPEGLPFGIPGIGDDMDGAMQHAPQSGRQFINSDTISREMISRINIEILDT